MMSAGEERIQKMARQDLRGFKWRKEERTGNDRS